ncbi:MAG: PKD domain-containing protein [Bacteroidota bacterium]
MKRNYLFIVAAMATLIGWTGINQVRGQAYLVTNNCYFVLKAGTKAYVDGNYINQNNGHITSNDSIIITGNWTNNAANGVFTSAAGSVVMVGAAQQIGGSNPTNFNKLVLDGTGVKSMTVSARVKTLLALGNREISTGNSTLFVDNTGAAAITRNTGFVSTGASGWLSRAVASAAAYTFPVGTGTVYRPADLTPPSAAADTFKVRFVNHDATNDGFAISNKENGICYVTNHFYHHIGKGTGSLSQASVTLYFDSLVDGFYDRIAHWQVVPQWQNTSTPVAVYQASPALSKLTISNWNNFNPTPFALAGYKANATINGVSPLCQTASPFNLTAATSGGLWTGTGITNTNAGTFSPAVAGPGTHMIIYSVTNINGCSGVDTTYITVNPTAGVPTTILGTSSFCQGVTSGNYTTTATNATTLNWSLTPAGAGTITGTGTTGAVTWNTGYTGNATISVTATNSCGTSTATTTQVSINPVPGVPTAISGAVSFCQGAVSGAYTTTATNASSYNWTISPAGAGSISGTGTTGTVTWNTGYNGNVTISVTSTNSCGTSTATSTNITINPTPGVPTAISGTTPICQGTTSGSFTSSATNATSFNWSLTPSGAGTISGTGSTGTVSWNTGYSGNAVVSVTSTNTCGTSAPVTMNVVIDPLPGVPSAISGSNSICQGTTSGIYTSSATNASSYNWTISPSGAGSISGTGTTGTVSWNTAFSGNATIAVTSTNSCGTSTAVSLNVSVNPIPGTPTAISGTSPICQGTPSGNYTTTATNATSFNWTLSPSGAGSIIGTGTTGSVTWNSGFSGTATLSVTSTNACGTSSATNLNVIVDPIPGVPVNITGPNSVCQGNPTSTYTTTATNATTYNWTITPAGAGTISGTGASALVTWVNGYIGNATIGVTATNNCGTSALTDTVIVVGGLPGTPSAIHGSNTLCQGTTSTAYTVSSTNATDFQWTLTPPAAGAIIGNGSTGTVYWGPTFSGTATVSVTASNACDTTGASSLIITVLPAPTIPSNPNGNLLICPGETVTPYLTGSANALGFIWTISPAGAGTITPFGDSLSVTWTPGYYGNADICVSSYNNCDTTTIQCTQVSIVPGAVAGFTFVVNNADVTFTNTSSNSTSFAWAFGDNTNTTVDNPVHTYGATGNYYVQLVAFNQCGSDTLLDTVTIITTSIDENNGNGALSIYPNPFDGNSNLVFTLQEDDNVSLEIFDVAGKRIAVLMENVNLRKGNYTYEITDDMVGKVQGVFLVRFTAGDKRTIEKLIHL